MSKLFSNQIEVKKTIFLIIVFILISVFYITFEKPETVTVIMTDQEYSPEIISIEKGTKVIFENQGEQSHWPASNFHPTHTLYPEKGGCIGSKFDACRGIESGETYEFKFDNVGTWHVHDHIFPGLSMTIIVSEDDDINTKKSFDLDIDNIPSPDSFRDLSYSEQDSLVALMVESDPVMAWQYIKNAFLVDNQVVGNAHEFSHTIGNAIYNKLGLEGIINCDAAFAFGCYHGVTEELLSDQGVDSVLKTQEKCIQIYPPNANNLYTGCIHGMGHGLLSWEGLNVSRALQDCDLLDSLYRNYCYDGVFMENAFLATDKEFEPNNFWNFCLKLNHHYQYNCGRYQVPRLFSFFSNDFTVIGQECSKAPNEIFRKTCAESMGYSASQTSGGKRGLIIESCAKIEDEETKNLCIIGAARETIFQEYTDWQVTSKALCESLSAPWLKDCLESNTRVKEIYNRD